MGAAASGATGQTLTRADVLKATENPRIIVNKLFTSFMEKFVKKDIFGLANPARCSDYVFVMADALDKTFYQLRLEPGQDKKGILFFRKTAEITAKTDVAAASQMRKQMCLSMAYFYIRIFQIYAALALSVQDYAEAGRGQAGFIGQDYGQRLLAPGIEGAIYGGGTTGGAVGPTVDLGTFGVLRNYINRYTGRIGEYYFDNHRRLSINTRQAKKNLTLQREENSEGPSLLTATLEIRPSATISTKKVIYMRDYRTGSEKTDKFLKKHGPNTFTIEKVGVTTEWHTSTGEQLDNAIYNLMSIARDVASGIAPAAARRVPGALGVPGATGAYAREDVGHYDGLKAQASLAKLKAIPKPLAHCVGRALQLLNFDALATPNIPIEIKSSICRTKFDAGLPDKDASITTSPGIAALGQLFYDSLATGQPSMSEDAKSSYQTAIKDLAKQFSGTIGQVKFDGILNKVGECGSSQKDKIITVTNKGAIKLAQQTVQTLWQLQIQHDKEVVKILGILIVVGSDNRLRLNPQILQTGIPGVNIVAKMARELLVKYYSNCEAAFRFGARGLGASQVLT